ncbi:MAG: exodeoxyribonuclease VII large subunit [Defluviitaleaceae bacterium]|nr:exodeoxyribonuclease VII large subunit [Defluviitaleaceae bacterium]MCL2274323.1 exodeoxyribonuclease VII large subunit [Defluviitaleaceae bacterium]
MSPRRVFTVSQLNRYAKKLLESDALLAGVFIEGEISNFNAHSSGHFYFSLKDGVSSLSAVMFASHTGEVKFAPKNGLKIIAFGRLSLYEKTGQYQLYVEYLEPAGIGALHLAFAQLCEKLQAEGLFDAEKKREIPAYAKCVAIITSPTGAAVRDIIKVAQARNPTVQLVVAPALVQGEAAAQDIARAIAEVNAWGKADVIILGRGGGSAEDLWAFNEEVTARAVAASRIPIISAVGHETDTVITDFTADLRAPTPSVAAQIAVYDHAAQYTAFKNTITDLHYVMRDKITEKHALCKNMLQEITRLTQARAANERQTLLHRETLLTKLSPYAAFKRGFAFVKNGNNTVTGIQDVQKGETLSLHWANGTAQVKVLKTEGTTP